jgi:hypothetical protein
MLGLCLAAPVVWVAPAPAAALSEADRKLVFFYAEADRLAAFAEKKAWPGFAWDKYPLVVWDPDRVAFQFNGTRPLPGFSPLSGAPATGRRPIFVKYGSNRALQPGRTGDKHDYLSVYGGQRIISMARSGIEEALPQGYVPPSLLYFPVLIHLRDQFPWFRDYIRHGEDWIAQYPLHDTENFSLADLEGACLRRAVTTTSADDAQMASRWFCAVRMARQAKLSPNSVRHESYQEALVGMSRYSTLHLASYGSSPDYQPLGSLKSAYHWNYPTQADLAKWLAASLDAPMDTRGLVRDRLRLTGFGQCMLLDRLGMKDWRKALAGTSNLTPLLARAAGYQDGARADLVEEAKKELGFEVISARARGIVENNLRMIEAFDRQTGWTVTIAIPEVPPSPAANVGLRWEPAGYWPMEIDSRTHLFIPPYKAIHYTTPNMIIELSALPAKFYSADYANPFKSMILRLPLGPGSVQLDGAPLALRPQSRTIGKSLTIKMPKAVLTFKKGRLTVKRDSIEIQPQK